MILNFYRFFVPMQSAFDDGWFEEAVDRCQRISDGEAYLGALLSRDRLHILHVDAAIKYL